MSWLSDDSMKHLRSVVDLPDLSGTHYRIGEKIASGGMATVYQAEDTRLKRKVSIKVLSGINSTQAYVARMRREAEVIAQLEHPGIVPIHDLGKLPDGRIYYVMKFVEGQTLDRYFSEEQDLSARLRVFLRVIEAVNFAHSHGVLHRDIKPTNVMIGGFGEVLLMDWGIASRVGHNPTPKRSTVGKIVDFVMKSVESNDPAKENTADGVILGTPAYMSPEQARGASLEIDEQSDVYALGAVLYFLLTGRPPHEGESPEELQKSVIEKDAVAPRQLVKSVPKPLNAICLRALSREKEERYVSAKALGDEITRFLDDKPVAAYRENIFEKIARWVAKNQFIVLIILAYIIIRFFIMIFLGR